MKRRKHWTSGQLVAAVLLCAVVLAAAFFWGFTLYGRAQLKETVQETFAFLERRVDRYDKYVPRSEGGAWQDIEGMLDGYTFQMNGVVVVTDGSRILSSNLSRLVHLSLDEGKKEYIGYYTCDAEGIARLVSRQGTFYGGKEEYNSYTLYAFFPAREVYGIRNVVMLVIAVLTVVFCLVLLLVRGQYLHDVQEQSQKRLRTINALSTAYTAIMLIQLEDGSMEVLKSGARALQNYKAHLTPERQEKQIGELVKEPYRKGLQEFSDMSTIAQRLKGHTSLTYSWECTNGRWLRCLIVPQRYSANGELRAVLVANRDITDEKQKELEFQRQLEKTAEDARRANAAKTDFLRRMSHDVRTPINGIQGMVEISRHYAGNEEKQEECRQKILAASGFLLDLVNNVLDMNKLESGEIKLEHRPFDLQKLLADTESVIDIQAREKGVELVCSNVQGEHLQVLGSPVHLRQVVQNIVSNAVKYTPAGGTVTVQCRECGMQDGVATFALTCADNGIGMSEEFQKKAFEPFAQENCKARTAYAGTGLGLAITKELVDQMGGSIRFESRQGEGTTFFLTLPLEVCTDAVPVPEAAPEPERAASIAGVRVLLVEDNELNMEIASFLLENAGAIVTRASNGQEAVDTFKASAPGTFDIILMDVMMPVMNGLDATRTIRALHRPDAVLPIFAMTANAFQDDRESSLAAGMNEHLTKPLDQAKLLQMIARYCGDVRPPERDTKI